MLHCAWLGFNVRHFYDTSGIIIKQNDSINCRGEDNICHNLNMKICGNSPRSHIAVWTVLSQRGLESLWWYGWSLWGSEPTGIRGNQISVSPECWSRNKTQRKKKLIYSAKTRTIHWHVSIYLHKGVNRFPFKPASGVAVMTLWRSDVSWKAGWDDGPRGHMWKHILHAARGIPLSHRRLIRTETCRSPESNPPPFRKNQRRLGN